MKRIIKFVFSGEFIFAAFLLSSVFKSALDEIIPIDVTVIFMALSIFIAIKRFSKTMDVPKAIIAPFLIYSILGIIIIISNTYSRSEIYAMDKTIRYLFLTGWSFIGVFILIKTNKSLLKFLKAICVISIATSFYVIYNFRQATDYVSGYTRVGVDGDNVLGLARIVGMACIIIFILQFYKKDKIKKKIIPILCLFLLLTTLVLTGSRMPLLSLIISILALLTLSFRFKKREIRLKRGALVAFSFLPILPIGLIPLYNSGAITTVIDRLLSLFSTTGDQSSLERVDQYNTALNMFKENPFMGEGIGSFSLAYGTLDQRSYPHNIFLELLSELGIWGFIAFLALLILSLVTIVKVFNKATSEQLCIIILTIFMFLNANTSGDINDNRILFAFIALCTLLPNFRNSKKEHANKVISQSEQTAS